MKIKLYVGIALGALIGYVISPNLSQQQYTTNGMMNLGDKKVRFYEQDRFFPIMDVRGEKWLGATQTLGAGLFLFGTSWFCYEPKDHIFPLFGKNAVHNLEVTLRGGKRITYRDVRNDDLVIEQVVVNHLGGKETFDVENFPGIFPEAQKDFQSYLRQIRDEKTRLAAFSTK